MDYVTLGRTGLKAGVMGLGGGGFSQLGLRTGGTHEQAVAVVRRALELGVNLIDTAEIYRTESAIGDAIRGRPRHEVILSTKKSVRRDEGLIRPEDVQLGLEGSLKRLGLDYIDIYHAHGVRPEDYPYVRDELVPAMRRLREQGKIRFLGITELFESDSRHRMLAQAVWDDCWDVMMVGFNILNPSARREVFPHTGRRGIGTLGMFAVRKAFSNPGRLREIVATLVENGQLDPDALDPDDPLGFLTSDGHAAALTEAAYRYCRHESGLDVVLSGTGNLSHLETNARSLCRPPLPRPLQQRLHRTFARVDSVSGQ